MFTTRELLLCLCLFLKYYEASKIPPYFSQCSIADPNLGQCIASNANGGLNTFVKGDKTYNIQGMLPLYVSHISLRVDKNLKINLTNCFISEMDGVKVKDAQMRLNDKHLELAMYMPRATVMGQYSIKGKFSIIPIDEKGPVNITVVHSRIKYFFDYELLERKGKHYLNITESGITYKSERAYFTFYNLFPNNESLSSIINQSLNDNWFETNTEIGPAIAEGLAKVTTKVLQGFFDKVSFEALFSE